MPLLNDNDIDRLSREAAEQYDVDQGPSGWEALQQRLDEELPKKRRRGLLLWWLLAGLLLAGGVLLLMKREGSGRIADHKKAAKEELASETSNSHTTTIPSDEPVTQTAREINKTAVAPGITTKSTIQANLPNDQFMATPVENTISKNNTIDRSAPKKNKVNNPGITNTPALSSVRPANAFSNNNLNTEVNKTKPEPTLPFTAETTQHLSSPTQQASINTSATDSSKTITVTSSVPAKLPTAHIPDSTADKLPAPSSSRKNSFYAALIAGPDFSNVKFSTAGRTGFNAGIQFGFYLTDRLSLNTGIVYNKKNYKARGKDFTSKGAMRYVDVKEVTGNCSMFDIPLNIRYDVSVKRNTRYFLSAGMSSYLMDKEDYDYYYYYNGAYGERNWNTDTNSNYFFSVINLSAGWESAISNKLQLQAEPYLKIPVRGVGNGNIQLNSFGFNLGLKYRFGKNTGNK